MNLTRDKAIETMDLLTKHGYTVVLSASIIGHDTTPYYRVHAPALHYEDVDLRALCDLAESIGLHCRYSLQAIRFEADRDAHSDVPHGAREER